MSEATVTSVGDSSFFAEKLTDRQKMTKRNIRLALVGVLLIVGLVALRPWQTTPVVPQPAQEPVAQAMPVITVTAERVESYSRLRSYTGVLREARRSQLSFQRGGELLELKVDEGQVVKQGQTLGRLDARHIRARRAQVEAQVAESKAVLAELVAGPRKETIAAKRAELRAQQSQRAVLESQLARRERLLSATAVSREEYETYKFDLQAAVAREDVIQRQLDEMVAGTRVEKISAQRARLAQLDAQLTDIAHDLEDTDLVAPFHGRVAQRFVDEGNVISAGTPVLEIIEDDTVEAWIGLPPQAAATLQVGQQRKLQIGGETLTAVVQSLAPDVQQTSRTRNVILRLAADQQTALPGQVVRLAVSEEVQQPGYWVPTTALTRGTRGLWSVYVVDDGMIGRRDIELLDTIGTDSFVRGTLQQGDEIVASGTHRVVLGQRVTTQSGSLAHRTK
ncbi:MAG: efflux RND transporter periplasmic adaptor subunit [Planctomycetota bacterium]